MGISRWLAAFFILAVSAGCGWSQSRVALLLGNSAYQSPSLTLANPANDVSALSEALSQQGFDVIARTDQSKAGMEQAIDDFAVRARHAEIALLFYAGHGVQLSGDNYLIGVDFEGNDTGGLEHASVRMSDLRRRLESADAQLLMVILDACRDTPFAGKGLTSPGLKRESGGIGSLIAYSTDPGNVALDGTGRNSVFTKALVEHVGTPGLDVRLMLGRVRQQVVLETGGAQVPWVEEAVIGEHVLSAQPAAEALAQDPEAEEIQLWRLASARGAPEEYERYLAMHPDGLFAEIARARLGGPTDTPQAGAAESAPVLLAEADPKALAAALATLGLLRAAPGEIPSSDALTRSFGSFRARQLDPGRVSADDLYVEAGRYAAFLAAITAQRIRTDLVALRSVDRTLVIAEDALAQMEALAKGDDTYLAVLSQARSDVVAIRESRKAILRRLDLTREYYAELIEAATAYMPPSATLDLLGGIGGDRSTVSPARATLDDARRFLDHVERARQNQIGSYQWLSDYLPGA